MSKSTMESSVGALDSLESNQLNSESVRPQSPHRIEEEIRHRLAEAPHLAVSSLVVRRVDGGVCLQGVAQTADDVRDICSLTQSVNGVGHVVNRLLVAPPHTRTFQG